MGVRHLRTNSVALGFDPISPGFIFCCSKLCPTKRVSPHRFGVRRFIAAFSSLFRSKVAINRRTPNLRTRPFVCKVCSRMPSNGKEECSMRILRIFAVFVTIVSTTFLSGCCCKRACDWGRRPCSRRCDAPQYVAPYSSCSPCAVEPLTPQPMTRPGYESGNSQ
jgi:hypothetical protein